MTDTLFRDRGGGSLALVCWGGEARTATFRVLRDGAAMDQAGREYAFRIFRAGRPDDPLGTDLRAAPTGADIDFELPADSTDALAGVDGFSWELALLLGPDQPGRRVLARGPVEIKRGAAAISGTGTAGADVVELPEDTAGVVTVQAMGAPGLSPWEAQGKTLAEYEAPRTATIEETQAALNALGDPVAMRAELDQALALIDIFAALYPISGVTLLGNPLVLAGNPITLGGQ